MPVCDSDQPHRHADAFAGLLNVAFQHAIDALLKARGNRVLIEGADPQGDLLETRDGYLYGVTRDGGSYKRGIIVRMQTDGSGFAVVREFAENEGGHLRGGLVENRDGNLYGVTAGGGAHQRGSIYQLTTDGRFNLLHSFTREDGASPLAALIEGGDGHLYSVTRMGGHKNRGVIYKLSTDGQGFALLHSFDGADGANPASELAQGTDGFLYGVASHGGVHDGGVAFRLREDGSNFAVLHEFDKYDLETPEAPSGTRPTLLMVASDNNLYGTTRKGGEHNQGMAFRMRLEGSDYETLHSFSGYGDKQLMQDADGRILVPVREGEKSGDAMRLKSIFSAAACIPSRRLRRCRESPT